MYEPKPFASLGPTLLARKGGARPAMRPQLSPLLGGTQADPASETDHEALEDLGWNDMGDADESEHPADIVPIGLTPMGQDFETEDDEYDGESDFDEPAVLAAESAGEEAPRTAVAPWPVLQKQPPEVLRQRHTLSETLREDAPPRRRTNGDGRRAAFTLRLDSDRHLKLRLASTVRNRSAQQLVTEALDRFLADIPEIEALAAQVSRN